MAKKHKGINKRKDGLYAKDIRIKGKRKTVYGRSPQEVLDKIEVLEADSKRGRDVHVRPMKLGEFLFKWLDEIVAIRNKPRTAIGYRQIVTVYIVPELGHILLSDLRYEDVQAFVSKLSLRLAPRTVRNARACLRRALNHAMRLHRVSFNAATLVDMPRARRTNIAFLEYEQARMLLNICQGTYWHLLYRIALELGLREGEILGLYKSDINLKNATITLTGTLQDQKGKLVREPFTKTDEPPKPIPLSSRLISLLIEQLSTGKDSPYLFSDKGKPISPYKLTWWFKKHLRQAELPNIRFHDLRHTSASFLIKEGEHPRMVMEHLRHKSFNITMDTYGHIMPSDLRQATNKIAESLDGLREKQREENDESQEKP